MSEGQQVSRQALAAQIDRLRHHFAKLGIEFDFDYEIDVPPADEPLAELFQYLVFVQDNLRELDRQNKAHVQALEAKQLELERQLETTRAQQQVILELSTPTIKVWDEILVLPLIGTFDTTRARQLTAQLLDAVSAEQARVVIIDVTGVPVIDTVVAKRIVEAVRAAQLLGAEAVITGIQPRIATTLVRSGVAFERVVTKATMRDGLAHAFAFTGRQPRDR